MSTIDNSLRLALIGCGAVTERSHVPALKSANARVTLLTDPSEARRAAISEALGRQIPGTPDAASSLDAFDAAIVAVPHMLHEAICVPLLRAGKHILVEKPMAGTLTACEAMNAAAAEGGARLAVGLMRRQARASLWVHHALAAGALGKVERFSFREGAEYGWPLTTDSMWRRETAGGGSLMDTGAHTLDQIVWWFGAPDELEYYDDSDGGVETDCLIRMRWASGLQGEVELSRTRKLSNAATIYSDRGKLTVASLGNAMSGDDAMMTYSAPGIGKPPFSPVTVDTLFLRQLEAFAAYTAGEAANVVSGEEGAVSVGVIERCYRQRRKLDLPWIKYTANAA